VHLNIVLLTLKERCQRESCKYFHPPHHIKLQLEANGRLLKQHKQQLQAMASHNMIQSPATVVSIYRSNVEQQVVLLLPILVGLILHSGIMLKQSNLNKDASLMFNINF
jgi:hypothetical protein